MRYILALLILSNWGMIYCQNFDYSMDFEKLLDQSKNKASVYYYPKLFERFNNVDSTLTNLEMIAMQIGFTDNPNYKPYSLIEKEREIMNAIIDKKLEDALFLSNEVLKVNPLNFIALMGKSFTLFKLNKDSSLYYAQKFKKIRGSILWSGNGTINHPYFILGPIDGQMLIRIFFQASIVSMGSGSDSNGYFMDILEMKKEGEEPIKLYFNINHAKDKMFSKEERENIENRIKNLIENK